ncbi:MAG: DUF4115 domain-containing protein [Chloroflexi bacterium]|nr:DUF4115 domain-containing protein [Chloroflexota bacterium]MCI0577547.1 DUF4115 domain-containing protein [Chloroflexota bacterium]MCI0645614.1 DUF4115 domain-containing protein [Chloroflexota bacterium]MCI0725526.1 DUF4115 domain-containing protein [Chloroflexota bacterium]
MDELGTILREAREARGLTLAEAQDATRISARFLEALEKTQYEALPTPVHVRGYLRNYARFLGLDPKPLLERYEFSKGRRSSPVYNHTNGDISPDTPIPPRDDQPFFSPVNLEIPGGRREGGSIQRLFIIVALLITLGLIANRFIPLLTGRGDGTEALTTGINDTVNQIINNGGEQDGQGSEPAAGDAEDEAPPNTEPITATNRNAPIQIPTATATRPALPATLEVINLRLEITERTWVQVTIDGEMVYEGQAVKDDLLEWEAAQEAKVLTGNAAGVFVTINEIQLGRLGGRGEVVEETWTTTGNS